MNGGNSPTRFWPERGAKRWGGKSGNRKQSQWYDDLAEPQLGADGPQRTLLAIRGVISCGPPLKLGVQQTKGASFKAKAQ